MMKRVFCINGIEVEAHQYIGIGPLLVKLPDDRGEIKAKSTDYMLYLENKLVGVVPSVLIDKVALPVEEKVYEEKVVAVGDAGERIEVSCRGVGEGVALYEEPAAAAKVVDPDFDDEA